MDKLKRMLALTLAAALTLAGGALAEEESAPVDVEVVEEIVDMDLPVEIEAPQAEEAPAPAEAEAEAPEPAAAPEEAAPAPVAEEAAVAAPAAFQTSLTLGVKEQAQLNGAQLAGGAAVTYVSSKPKLVSVDANGLLTARKKGTAVVTVYSGETALGACSVTVLKAPKKVTFPEKSLVMSKGQGRAFPAALPKGCAGTIRYTSDNAAVLAVDAAGNLTGVSGGSATVTATAYNGKKATCAVRVLGGPAPTWVKLNLASLQLPVKGTAQLVASFDEGRDAIVTYTTSNKKLVTVNDQGVVTAKRAGQATITATTHNGLTATCAVQVFIAPKKVTLNVNKLTMKVNEGYQLIATLTKNSVSDITWTSDNANVATVDNKGFITTLNVGQANITATTTNGKKATCKLTVQDESGSVGRGTVIYQEDTPTLKVKIVNDNGVILSYIWAKDPSRQLFKNYGNAKPIDIMNDAVKRNGLADKIVVGFNASPPVSPYYLPEWSRIPEYRYREPSPLMIANGQVLVNDPNKETRGKYLYWLDGNSNLCFSEKTLDQYTAAERATLYKRVIDSGARNTMIWRPVLIANRRALPLTEAFLTKTAGKKRKQALCQIDSHNYIVVTGSSKGMMDYPHFQRYLLDLGVVTAVEFDAGGSSTVMYKPKNSPTMKKLVGGGRTLSMMMYFTE